MPTINQLITIALAENKLDVPSAAQEKLSLFLNLMQTWNQVFNLTAITNPREMVYLHIIDSLVVQPLLHGKRLLDVGSGAGLPGIPLAIVNPDQHWVLIDKSSKKTRFQIQAIAELGLSNVEAVHARCEDFQATPCFDSILSRAFGTIRMFVETTEHLLGPNGVFIAMKGKYPQDELDALPAHLTVQSVTRLDIKGLDIERHVVCISRTSGSR